MEVYLCIRLTFTYGIYGRNYCVCYGDITKVIFTVLKYIQLIRSYENSHAYHVIETVAVDVCSECHCTEHEEECSLGGKGGLLSRIIAGLMLES